MKTQQWTWWELLPELCGNASICASSAVSPDEGLSLGMGAFQVAAAHSSSSSAKGGGKYG